MTKNLIIVIEILRDIFYEWNIKRLNLFKKLFGKKNHTLTIL